MDSDVQAKIELCERADGAEWEEIVARAARLDPAQRAFLKAHDPALVRALWVHFAATRDRCGCATNEHERPSCSVRLVERLLLDEELG